MSGQGSSGGQAAVDAARSVADERGAKGGQATASLYEKRKRIHTLWVDGRFQSIRRYTLTGLVLFFYLLPWLSWDGQPAVWLNLPERKFTILGLIFWPQDFILLSWLLIIAAFGLFCFTVYAGRLWCGYACPQTVWTWLFIWVEHLVEGDRNQRIRLDRSPWNANKLIRRGLKQLLWVLLAASIAVTCVGLFTPIRQLGADILTLSLSFTQTFWLLLVTALSYVFSTGLREQVCIYMCPYARFQSVMFDRNTLIISYDEQRGEPRGNRRKSISPEQQGVGSCIDCKLCVHACPTGIDIRDGLQAACIGCAACIDVCDGVMEKMGYPPGLVRYSTENELAGVEERRLSPQLFGYGAILAVMIGLFSYQIFHRIPLELDVVRDRNRLYRETYDGGIENVYTLKIINMDRVGHQLQIQAVGEIPLEYGGDQTVFVESGEVLSLPLHMVATAEQARAAPSENVSVRFTIQADADPNLSVSEGSRFLLPAR